MQRRESRGLVIVAMATQLHSIEENIFFDQAIDRMSPGSNSGEGLIRR